ncbi:MAG: TlpA disulfide reductase family protein [Ilumatobacteraceae bacterium]
MRIRRRLMVTSLIVAAVAAVPIGWAVARSGDGGSADGDTVVISGPRVTFQEPSIGTNARVEGQPFPAVTIQTLAGDDLATASLAGTPLVVNIWGSTCGPCKQELPDFAAAHAAFGDRVRFVGISYLPPATGRSRSPVTVACSTSCTTTPTASSSPRPASPHSP